MPDPKVYDAYFGSIVAEFRRLLSFEDSGAIRSTIAAVIANRIVGGEPVWLFIVGPSSSGKTEFINALEGLPETHLLSQLTPNTFLSGFNAKVESSLLLRLPNPCVLLQKDFTTILGMRPDDRQTILSQLREIYDGKLVKEFGTGVTKSWIGKLGFISGVTLEIEETLMMSARFGDRFLYYRMASLDNEAAMKKAQEVAEEAGAIRASIREKVSEYVSMIPVPTARAIDDQAYASALRALCDLAVLARTGVRRDGYGAKEIIDIALPEGPIRMFKELSYLADALMAMSGGVLTEADYLLLAKIATGGIPRRRMIPLEYLEAHVGWSSTTDIALSVGIPSATMRYALEELSCCGLVDRRKGDEKNADEWCLRDEARRLMGYRRASVPSEASAAPVAAEEFQPPV